jgi:DNA gyrase subunit B
MSEYDGSQIQVLKGLEAVRRRPGMYVGDTTNGSGLHHLLWEIVANVIDLHLVGHASELHVELSRDRWITVRDDGPGIPTDIMPPRRRYVSAGGSTLDVLEQHVATDVPSDRDGEDNISILEAVCTRLHAGATWDSHFPHVHIAKSMHGVGMAAVNALSERFEVETTYGGIRWAQEFERGERVSPLRRLGPTAIEGTTMRFRPDPTIFSTIELDHEAIRARLMELAWLNPHLRVWMQERRLHARGGIRGWARQLASERGPIVDRHELARHADGIGVDLALVWNRSGAANVHAYVNMHRTPDGSHIRGLWLGFADYARAVKSPVRRVEHVREAIGCGLVALINVGLLDARFGSPMRDQLTNPEASTAVRTAIRESLARDAWRTQRIRRFLDERLHVPRKDER